MIDNTQPIFSEVLLIINTEAPDCSLFVCLVS